MSKLALLVGLFSLVLGRFGETKRAGDSSSSSLTILRTLADRLPSLFCGDEVAIPFVGIESSLFSSLVSGNIPLPLFTPRDVDWIGSLSSSVLLSGGGKFSSWEPGSVGSLLAWEDLVLRVIWVAVVFGRLFRPAGVCRGVNSCSPSCLQNSFFLPVFLSGLR